MAKRCMSPTGAKWALGVGAGILVLSLAILFIFPSLYKQQLKKDIALTDGSLTTNAWRDIPLPLYEKLYFFNITNGDSFLRNEEPLNVTQVGPYTYCGKWIKRDPGWNSNNTVSYRETRTYQFVRDMSVGSQDDVINTLNGPMIIGADILKNFPIGVRLGYSLFLAFKSETIIKQLTIRQLVYEGYEDPIIKYAPLLKPDIPFKNGIFSWLYGKNDTDDGLFTAFTGADDPTLTNVILNWNGEEKMKFWKDDSCNSLNGTNVEMGPPLGDDPGDQTHFGVLTKRFQPTSMVFANSTENPDNKCFEVKQERASGVLDVSPCQFGAPVILSFPHFHMADPSYLNNINGLNPNAKDHGSHVDAEPITGITLDVNIRFQINLQMERVRGILQLDNVPEGIFPLFWADIEIQLNEEWAHFLKAQLTNPKIIAYTVLGFLVLCSVILIVSAIVILRLYQTDDDDDDPLIDVKEDKQKEDSKPAMHSKSSEQHHQYGAVTNKAGDISSDDLYTDAESPKLSNTSHVQAYPPSHS